jgi:hypothetical protein
MKKNYYFIAVILLFSEHVFPFIPLPYYTGFDNTTQQSGWQEFRKGFLSPEEWTYNSFNAYSAPNTLYHDYPVGSSGPDTTLDWFVSPSFDFSSGAVIDSVKIMVYSITGSTMPVDYFGIYLLHGSANPSAATGVIELANLTSYVSSAATWNNAGPITIPATSGTSYIAFKYRATNNWFTVSVDDLYINSITTGINDHENTSAITIAPNPVEDFLTITNEFSDDMQITITDISGKLLKSFSASRISPKKQLDVSELDCGIYFLSVTNGRSTRVKKFIKQ